MQKIFEWQYQDEKVLFKKHEHYISTILRTIKNWFLVLVVSIILALITKSFLDNLILPIIIIIIPIITYVYFIKIFHDETFFIFTNRRAIKSVRNGIFASHLKELKLENIRQTTSNNFWILGKVFNYWNINVQWPDEATSLYFRNVPENKNLVLYISRMLDYIKKEGYDAELWEYKSGYGK